jgi:hypothetical protein
LGLGSGTFTTPFTFNGAAQATDQYLYGVELGITYDTSSLQYGITLMPATISIPAVTNFPYNLQFGSGSEVTSVSLATANTSIPIGTILQASNSLTFSGMNTITNSNEVFSFDVDFTPTIADSSRVSSLSNINASATFTNNVYTITVSPTPIYFINNTYADSGSHASEAITITGTASPFSISSIPVCTGTPSCTISGVVQNAFNNNAVTFSTATAGSNFTMDFTTNPPTRGKSSNMEYSGSCVWNTPTQTPPGQVCTITYTDPTFNFTLAGTVAGQLQDSATPPNYTINYFYTQQNALFMSLQKTFTETKDIIAIYRAVATNNPLTVNWTINNGSSPIIVIQTVPTVLNEGTPTTFKIDQTKSYYGTNTNQINGNIEVNFGLQVGLQISLITDPSGLTLLSTPAALPSGTLTASMTLSCDGTTETESDDTLSLAPFYQFTTTYTSDKSQITANPQQNYNIGVVNNSGFTFTFAFPATIPFPPSVSLDPDPAKQTTIAWMQGTNSVALTLNSTQNSDGTYTVSDASGSIGTAIFTQGSTTEPISYSTLTITGAKFPFTDSTDQTTTGEITLNFTS